jgi:hypothetical protein
MKKLGARIPYFKICGIAVAQLQNCPGAGECRDLGYLMSSSLMHEVHAQASEIQYIQGIYRVFHFEVSISAPRLDHGSKSQQILTLARARLIWDFQPLGVKVRAIPVDFSDALNVKPVR